ncbi:MAG: phosphomannose isomerase type II C-terminal cupin domain [Syntrophaceae bacterium]|nr:phosphomannose isomerase type II C-terminal cupin domain [Syntrophaceae bacterium]
MDADSNRPWGFYEVLYDGGEAKVKRILVRPGGRLSLQRHRRRAEHWFVIRGEGTVTLDVREISVKAGDAMDIPQGALHRIFNSGSGDLVYIEVQTGDYFGEDDIERLADDYGRGNDG